MKQLLSILIIIVSIVTACEETVYTPKPRGYPRVVFPEKAYQKFDANYCRFSFEYPVYASIERDTLFFEEKAPSDCWFNIKVPNLNAVIYCSYYDIGGKNTYDKLRNDAFTLAGKHNLKADFIDELPVKKPNGVSGFVFNIEGPAACPFQFYLTDSTKRFVRGALYFNTQTRPDSLKPVVEFMKTDVMQLINTFEWR
jgi:gliding motility-associated lipoprotein GldD